MTEFKHTRLDNRQFTREDIKGFIQEKGCETLDMTPEF